MSYCRRYYLRRVLEAQMYVREIQEKHKGLPMTVIYRNYIRDRYHISKATFDRWMGVAAAAELRKIEGDGEEKMDSSGR